MEKEVNTILVKLLKKYSYKKPEYISNDEIDSFLEIHKGEMSELDFIDIKNYFLNNLKTSRYIFLNWEGIFPSIRPTNDSAIRKKSLDLPKYFTEYKNSMVLKQYSKKTIKAYTLSLLKINKWIFDNIFTNIDEVDMEGLKKYFLFLTVEKQASGSQIRIHRFSLEYYLKKVSKKVISLDFMKEIKTSKHLPVVFTKEEVLKILQTFKNLKHKTMVGLMYSSGLRISEVLKLRVKDIDLKSLIIHIKEAKGKKDRLTIISEKIISDLEPFLQNKTAEEYVFESNQKKKDGSSKPLDQRTLQKIFEISLKKADIKKVASPHDLRHSFATHLLESGTDIHFIQKLLGHKNISTTTIYTKLANPKIAGVKSPL